MKLLKLSNLNRQFVNHVEDRIAHLDVEDYYGRLAVVHAQCIDFSNFYKINLEKENLCIVEEALVNVPSLRTAWCMSKKKAPVESALDFAMALVEHEKPDLLFDHAQIFKGSVAEIKQRFPNIRICCTWDCWASTTADGKMGYDLYFTCLNEIRERYLKHGQKAVLNPFGFERSILDRIEVTDNKVNKVCFIGSISSRQHQYRNEMLIELNKANYLDWWIGNIGRGLFTKSKIRELLYGNFSGLRQIFPLEMHNRGKLFGIDMFGTMANYSMTLNVHGDHVSQIGNMRLTEAGGCGTCQLIDWKENARDYFEPDVEAVFFKSTSELLDKAKYLIENPLKAREIAQAGQRRVLNNFSFEHHVRRFWEAVVAGI